MPVIVSDTSVEIIPPAGPRPGGEPLAPAASRRYQRWLAAQRWLATHLLWVPRGWGVDVDLHTELWPGQRVRVRLATGEGEPPGVWAAGVARVWEDFPTEARPIPSGPDGSTPFLCLEWTALPTGEGEGVDVTIYSPHAADLAPYLAALVDAGILRADAGEGGGK